MVSFNTPKLCTNLGHKVETAKSTIAPSFKIGARQTEQAAHEIIGTTQLAEQNRASIIGCKKVTEPNSSTNFQFGTKVPPTNWNVKDIPYKRQGANVTLTYREGSETLPFDANILKGIKGYTDENGNVLSYILLDSLEVYNKGNGLGRAVMEDIKQIAKERCGGRLLLQPSNAYRNPSPFYYKCGLRPTSKESADEILAYLNNGTQFKSGSSAPMYLPIV